MNKPWLSKNKSLGKQTATLVVGTGIAQLVVIVATPLLTRLYSPDEYGNFSVIIAAATIISVIASLRYELAIPLASSRFEAANVVTLTLTILCLISLITCILVLSLNKFLFMAFNLSHGNLVLYLLPVLVFLMGANQIFAYWQTRKQQFDIIASTRISQSIGTVGTQLGIGLTQLILNGLIIGQVVGQMLGVSTLAWKSLKEIKIVSTSISLRRMKILAVKYRKFPLYSTGSALSNSASTNLPAVLLALLFSPVIAGFYALTIRILQAPMSLIGSSLAQTFYPRAAQLRPGKELSELVLSIYRLLVRVGMPILSFFALISGFMFPLLFGKDWEDAGTYAQLLTPYVFFVFISSPLSMLSSILHKQRIELIFQVLLLAGRVVTIFIGYWVGSPILAIACFSAISAAGFFWFTFWNMRLIGVEVKQIFSPLLTAVIYTCSALLPAFIAVFLVVQINLWFFVLIALSLSLIVIISFKTLLSEKNLAL